MSKPKVLIVRAAGTNGDLEAEAAFELAGGAPERVHINALIKGEKKLKDFDVLVIPGGFSYGDHISAGRVLANELKGLAGLATFISSGKPVLGICNGFQVLVKAGLLPGKGDEQTVTLAPNLSGRFECQWVRLKVAQGSLFTKGLPDVIELPVANAEGRFFAPDDVAAKLEKQVAFKYEDPSNGSVRSIAGLTNSKGNVLGLMPHPERFIMASQHPWRMKVKPNELGLHIIKNAVDHVKD